VIRKTTRFARIESPTEVVMRRRLAAGGVVLALAWLAPGGLLAADDEASVREIVRRYVEAREARDEKAIAALFTEDADQLTSSGEWRRGRAAIVRGAQASSARTEGRRTITVETVRFLGSDAALADGRYEIVGVTGGDRKMWASITLTRTAAGWRIAAIRNMLPASPARP
jgi:uncharacterized protein (TIGR02246 family)